MLILILSSIVVEKSAGVWQLGAVTLEFVPAEGGSLPVTVVKTLATREFSEINNDRPHGILNVQSQETPGMASRRKKPPKSISQWFTDCLDCEIYMNRSEHMKS